MTPLSATYKEKPLFKADHNFMIVIEFKEMHLLSLSKCVAKSQYVTKMFH